MPLKATIVEDSISEGGARFTTFSLEYHNFIHPEMLTHKDKSRNVHSNRAIPAKKLRAWATKDTAMPVRWGINRPGMVATDELSGWRLWAAKKLWLLLANVAALGNYGFELLGVHKEIANRPLGPYIYAKVVLSGTEWDNQFTLRSAPDAQPEIRALTELMISAMNASVPRVVRVGDWHLPYVTQSERDTLDIEDQVKISVARCARVSYNNHEGKPTSLDEDIKLYDRLSKSGHMSPFEHQAMSAHDANCRSGNLIGWIQHRKMIAGENKSGFARLQRWATAAAGHIMIAVPK